MGTQHAMYHGRRAHIACVCHDLVHPEHIFWANETSRGVLHAAEPNNVENVRPA